MNQTILKLSLYVVSIFIIVFVAHPLYNGGYFPELIKSIPTLVPVTELMTRKDELENVVTAGHELLAKSESTKEQFASLTPSDKARLNDAIAPTADEARLIHDIDKIASQASLSILSPRFDSQQDQSESKKNPYNTTRLQFSVRGDYENFKNFIGDLESSLRLYNIRAVTINVLDPSGYSEYRVELQAFVKKQI